MFIPISINIVLGSIFVVVATNLQCSIPPIRERNTWANRAVSSGAPRCSVARGCCSRPRTAYAWRKDGLATERNTSQECAMTSVATPAPDQSLSESAADKAMFSTIVWRLMPLLFLAYGVNYIDRINIGFAKLQMAQRL